MIAPDVEVTESFDHESAASARAFLEPAGRDRYHGRFLPGAVVAGRYRVVGRLGSGGMGEVYRAHDLKLGEPVALKFLPSGTGHDPQRLEYFLNEVRLARQITHPHVCRVFDVGEVDGEHFLSMEYVDGEDLASLLRRIGRLPADKGVQIARQICSGLVAAHEEGVLHRDLKPANIMVDGKGHARIADFGLARQTSTVTGTEVRFGTPAYMAPEQLAGKEVTARSDIYALGLVLYEVFTGERVYRADSAVELQKKQRESTPEPLSNRVSDLDPAVERLILQCLETDPQRRPASVAALLQQLPGGDPLAAAYAAGETPSPEMVADASEEGTITPLFAAVCLTVTILCLAARILVTGSAAYHRIPLEQSPQQLSLQAQRMIAEFGYTDPPVDRDYRLYIDESFPNYFYRERDQFPDTDPLAAGRPPVIYFWYVQSPGLLVPHPPGTVTPRNPAPTRTGMVHVWLDTKGRLAYFHRVPESASEGEPSAAADGASAQDPDWSKLFAAADLDESRFAATEPVWNPPSYSDARAAWVGEFPEWPGMPVRVEAAAYRGRPVYFNLIYPWQHTSNQTPGPARTPFRTYLSTLMPWVALFGGAWLAHRNWRRERVDRRGAFRISCSVFVLHLAEWAFRTHHVPLLPAEMRLLLGGLGEAVFWSAVVWVSYLAIEPYLRHRWPWRIISWSRLLAGRFRDPMVGRHVLLGVAVGATSAWIMTIHRELPHWLGYPASTSSVPLGMTDLPAMLTETSLTAIRDVMMFCFLFLATTILFRRELLAAAALVIVAMIYFGGRATFHPLLEASFVAVTMSLYLAVFFRSGVLPVCVGSFVHWLTLSIPLTTDLSDWYAGNMAVSIFLILAAAIYGLVTSVEAQGTAPVHVP